MIINIYLSLRFVKLFVILRLIHRLKWEKPSHAIAIGNKQHHQACSMKAIKTPTPVRAEGQKDVLRLTLPPMPVVRIAFVGLGQRGLLALNRWCHIPHTEIVAICDAAEKQTVEAQKVLQANHKASVPAYCGASSYHDLCKRTDVDLIYICTDWDMHTPIVLSALHHGKNVAVEVPGAMTLEEIWQIVDAAEKMQRHCMMLENSVYDFFELATQEMVRKGVLGDIVHVGGGYMHPLGNRWTRWRIAYNKDFRGDLYPTHGFGPICRILDIHRTDWMDFLVAMDTAAFTGPDIYKEVMGEDSLSFSNGDQTSIMIRTRNGKTMQLQHNVMTPRPYSRQYEVVGRKGYVAKYPALQICLAESASTASPIPVGEHLKPLSEADAEQMINQYLPAYAHDLKEEACSLDARGGMSYLMDYRLAEALHHGKALDMDVYDLAEWCCLTELSRISIENGSMPVVVPDFTRR